MSVVIFGMLYCLFEIFHSYKDIFLSKNKWKPITITFQFLSTHIIFFRWEQSPEKLIFSKTVKLFSCSILRASEAAVLNPGWHWNHPGSFTKYPYLGPIFKICDVIDLGCSFQGDSNEHSRLITSIVKVFQFWH